MTTNTRKFANLPALPEYADDDEVLVRDVSSTDPAKAVARSTIADLRDAVGGGGSSDKIQDTAGTTRVETEEETGRVTVTAGGHKAASVGKDKVLYESEVDPATGTVIKVQRGADLLEGASGHHVTVERGGDVIASTVVAAMPDGQGGIALLNLSAGASTGDLYTAPGSKARWDLMVDLQDEVVRTQTEVETEGGSTAIFESRAKDVSGGVWARMGAYDPQDGVLSGVRVDSDGVHTQAGTNNGRVIRPGGAELPSGDDSLADWIARVEGSIGIEPDHGRSTVWRSSGSANGFPNQSNYILSEAEYNLLQVGDLAVNTANSSPESKQVYVCTNKGTLGAGGAQWRLAFPYSVSGNTWHANNWRVTYLGAPTDSTDAARWLDVGDWNWPSGNAVNARSRRLENLGAPTGDSHAARLVDVTSRDPVAWTPTWTGAANVDGTPTTNEGSIKVDGDYVDIEVELEVTSLGAGQTLAVASLPAGIDPPTKERYGQGTALYDGVNFIPALCMLQPSGTLTVGLSAAGADVHTACVRLRYLRDDS